MMNPRQAPLSKSVFTLRIVASLAAIFAVAALAACSGFRDPPKEADPNIEPKDYQTKLLSEFHSRLADPVGVRDAALSPPVLRQAGGVERYIACVRYNAKNDLGQYDGITERAVFFYGGNLTQVVDNGAKEICRGAAYQPWPEMTRMCKEAVCPQR